MTDPDLLTQRLKTAVEAVNAAEVPEDLREIAFTRALDVLLGAPPAGKPAVPPPASPGVDPQEPGTDDPDDKMEKLAQKLGIDLSTAAEVYDIDEDGLHLVVAPSKHGNVTTAMEQIARLVVAGRQAAGLDDEWTPLSVVRAVCESRGKYSQGNFSTYVKRLDGDGFRIRGSGVGRAFKANAAGFEATGKIVSQLAGQE